MEIRFQCQNEECNFDILAEVTPPQYDFDQVDNLADGFEQGGEEVVCPECETTYSVIMLARDVGLDVTLDGFPEEVVEFRDPTFDEHERIVARLRPDPEPED